MIQVDHRHYQQHMLTAATSATCQAHFVANTQRHG